MFLTKASTFVLGKPIDDLLHPPLMARIAANTSHGLHDCATWLGRHPSNRQSSNQAPETSRRLSLH